MMQALRAEVNRVLQTLPCTRKPFLRRSLREDQLLCTDLPRVADAASVQLAVARLQALGWLIKTEDGLLQMDKMPPTPTSVCLTPAGEQACLIALLQRHPNERMEADLLRSWLKKVEAHEEEELMRLWHREWAIRLRRHQPLPGGMLPWLLAYQKEERT